MSLWEPCKVEVSAVDGHPIDTPYVARKIQIHKGESRLTFDFVLLAGIEQPVLLGAPFLSAIRPMTVRSNGVIGFINGKEVRFDVLGSTPVLSH